MHSRGPNHMWRMNCFASLLKFEWILSISVISIDNKAKLRDGSYRINATDFRHFRRSKLAQATLIDPKSFIRVDCIQSEITLWGIIPPLGAIQANPSQSHSSKPGTSNQKYPSVKIWSL